VREGWRDRADVFTRTITVPFPPESSASGIGDPSFHPVVWYRRTFEVPPGLGDKRLILYCGAVDYRARVWINGRLVASHEGGQTPFSADITQALQEGTDQVIVIRAEDLPADLGQPRGKQDWQEQPHSIWYERTTGIWQPVWIEPVCPTYITGVRWTPDLDRAVLSLGVTVNREDYRPLRLRVQLSLHGVSVADDIYEIYGSDVNRDIALDLGSMTMTRERVLWSPGNPNLIDATLTLLGEDGPLDEVQSYAGLRSVGVAGGRFLLNGRPYYLRLALEQGYWPDTHLAAPSDEALRREVELTKDLGFNGVRVHQQVADPRYLYWCDRLGLLVWGEMANAYVFTATSAERFTREWVEVLERDASHPCIVMWVPLNESWGVPNLLHDQAQQHYVQALYHLTKALDPTRPVIGNDGWEYVAGDIFGIHDYSFHGQTILDRYGTMDAIARTFREVQPGYRFVTLPGRDQGTEGRPIMITEFGGISLHPDRMAKWFGYGQVGDLEEFHQKYRELVDAVLDCPAISGFCYTQLTDTLQETNGLLTADREPKLEPAVLRAINTRPAAAVPGDVISQMQRVMATPFGGDNPE
jgi:beta-galactosidase/beta-glucuronidase